ncbi:MAG: hypothetical protein ACI9G1_003081 [Pirellulaceae bacterium]|jgi:hypothetical protein
MIRRLVSILLVLVMLANQGLCMSHVHHGKDLADPEGHGALPHFHVGGHVHHERIDHSHSDNESDSDEHKRSVSRSRFPLGEHDSDVVYCGGPAIISPTGNAANVILKKDDTGVAILQVGIQTDGLRRLRPLRGQPPTADVATCPIYLRILSLRL